MRPVGYPLLLSTTLVPALVSAITLDCTQIRDDKVDFDFGALSGAYSVWETLPEANSIKNTTFTVDICQSLKRSKGKSKTEECPSGTRICATQRYYDDSVEDGEEPEPKEVWPIAGEFTHSNGRNLNPKPKRLKNSSSNSDADKEGLRLELEGGEHDGEKQKAIIEFLCDKSRTGLEGLRNDEGTEDDESSETRVRRQHINADDDDDDDSNAPSGSNDEKSLQFRSYKTEGEFYVLRLDWRTKYACEDYKDDGGSSGGKSKSHWGFFTWFIIILFMTVASYLIFGSWLNYSRHGARGWDLLPHGDTIRDLPYLLRDWARRVMSTVQGGGRDLGYIRV